MTDQNANRSEVFVTGGTGFVGRYIRHELIRQGFRVRLLVRDLTGFGVDDPDYEVDDPLTRAIPGNILEPEPLEAAMAGCSAVVHLVGIIREEKRRDVTFDRIHVEGTRNVVDAALAAGIPTFVHMSANGASPSGATRYLTSKWEAEEIVRSAAFDRWTVFRPSIIFGKPGPGCPEFATQLVNTLLKPFPVWPVFGDGMYELQPVAIEDVAVAFTRALTDSQLNGKNCCVAGPERFSYLEILEILARGAGVKSRPRIHQPLWFSRPLIDLFSPTGLLPITPGQLEMLVGGNTCDASALWSQLSIDPKPFNPQTLSYLRS